MKLFLDMTSLALIELFRLVSQATTASFNVPGKSSIPASLRSRGAVTSRCYGFIWASGNLFLTLQDQLLKIAAIAKYGFAGWIHAMQLIRVEMPRDSGIWISGERLRAGLCIIYRCFLVSWNLNVCGDFIVGLHTAVKCLCTCFL